MTVNEEGAMPLYGRVVLTPQRENTGDAKGDGAEGSDLKRSSEPAVAGEVG